eukprot:TRINITY_DN7664_c0_g1_i9.p1 TRINITY_DN7664_c0_g1~~TRINITY_DN7664_c0_g1_i9.p1  ORF type:complete len:139 (-),score=23.93 TRINITY_DN7664_c0_g1_i9:150-566(-)
MPRRMSVLLPKINEDDSVAVWKPMKEEDHPIYQYKKKARENMLCLTNKQPTWNPAANAYVLNFTGRTTLPSVKNFQLIDPSNGSFRCTGVEEAILMEFGKIGEEMYSMEICWPLSIFQAFGIVLSAFNYKYSAILLYS